MYIKLVRCSVVVVVSARLSLQPGVPAFPSSLLMLILSQAAQAQAVSDDGNTDDRI